ncbi:OLC1v1027435C1 [Oldenlandia corymbosa var. corymbosa]|uniref:OLC1v1027435C1 n=1 Tax=Oldenlandia corymbosa var. corymbosa TaxID=529605 RepID=A0AAV1CBD3_OLDCO|nr:OLC1v1027435C1 [Oldenlandia corymbosa var. corymbosa]
MPSLTTTWSPSSLQLRLAFAARRSPPPPFLRMRIRVFSVSENWSVRNNVSERRRSGDSWAVNPNSTSDGYAGWTDGEESSGDSNPKEPNHRIVVAGVAGALLLAGLTFAAFSFRNRGTSRVEQPMEPLTAREEVALTSDYNDQTLEDRIDSKNQTEDSSEKAEPASLDEDLNTSTVKAEPTLSKQSDDSDKGDESSHGDVSNITSLQQEDESSLDDTSVGPEEFPQQLESEFAKSSSGSGKVDLITLDLEHQHALEPEGDSVVTNSSLLNDDTSTISTVRNLSSEPSLSEPDYVNVSDKSQFDEDFEPSNMETNDPSSPVNTDADLNIAAEVSGEQDKSPGGLHNPIVNESSGASSVSDVSYPFTKKQLGNIYQTVNETGTSFDLNSLGITYTTAVIPAPSKLSTALQEFRGKVLIPAVVDQVQSQALSALQALKVIEVDVQPGDLCTRREYARWLVSASGVLSRSTVTKVYPAMYIENVTELAFDDIRPEDPDFPSIQGLAEAGLISSKLSRRDMQSSPDDDHSPVFFSPESPLSRQDLVSWKMALEKKQLPVVDKEILQQLSGFIDLEKIHPDAWPALVADIAAGDQGIMALSFGYTRLFQPDKPVTKAQAAIALATGEASEIVGEELARIEAESMAENVVAAHNALVAQVEEEMNASYEKELQLERGKIDAVKKLAEEARAEIERLRAEKEEENLSLLKERAAVDSEMEVLSRLRREMEEQLQTVMNDKAEISYEKERLVKLRKDAEIENQEIARLQYELEVERKALSMARAWAEDEAKRAREQAKSLDEARERWERQGIKVVVDDDLREEANVGVTWVAAGNESFVKGTIDRAENLVDKLKHLGDVVKEKSKDTIQMIIQLVLSTIHRLKELIGKAGRQAEELKDTAVEKLGNSLQEAQQSSVVLASAAKDGIKRFAGDCRDGVEKISQKFKT